MGNAALNISESQSELGALLRGAFASIGITDPKTIGLLVADAQEDPSRDQLPYHPAVVSAWLSGELLPPSAAIDAVHAIIDNAAWQAQIDHAFEEASFQPTSEDSPPATEMSVTLRGYFESISLHGCQRATGVTPATMEGYFRAEHRPTPSTLKKLDRYLHALGVSFTPSLLELDQFETSQSSRDRAAPARRSGAIPHANPDTVWDQAVAQQHFGKMLKACRCAMGYSVDEMAARLSARMPQGLDLACHGLRAWEARKELPHSGTYAGIDPLYLYRVILSSDAAGAQWFTPEREQAMARTYHATHPEVAPKYQPPRTEYSSTLDVEWKQAVDAQHVGKLLKLCRASMGLSLEAMAQRVAEVTGKPLTFSGLNGWEQRETFPASGKYGKLDPLLLYCSILQSDEQGRAFMTPAREAQLQQALTGNQCQAPPWSASASPAPSRDRA